MTSVASTGPQLRPYPLVLTALIAAEATGAFEASMLTTAVPKLIAEFQVGTTDIGWTFTGFLLMTAAAAAIGGKLGDLFGRKKILIIVLLLSILGSIVSIGIGTFGAIIAGRTIQGVSGAVLPLIMGISREAVEPKRVPVTMAVVAGTVTIAGALGFFVSGFLIQYVNWHSIFIAAGLLAAVAAVLCHFCLSPSPRTHVPGEKVDYIGGALFVPALAAILYGVTYAQTAGWGHPVVLGCLVAGVALGSFWVWWELRTPKALLNLRLLGEPKYALTMGIVAFLAFGAIGGMQLVQPIVFQSPTSAPVGLGLSPSTYGTIGLGIAVFGFLLAPLSGFLAGRAGAKVPMLAGMTALVIALPSYFLLRDTLPLMIMAQVLTAAGVTFALTSIPNLLAEAIPTTVMGEGMGFAVVIRSLFQAISVSVFSVTMASAVAPGTKFPTVGAFGLTIAVGTTGVVIALILVLLVRSGRRPAQLPATTAASPVTT